MIDGSSLSNISDCLFILLFLPLSLDFVGTAYTLVLSFNRNLFHSFGRKSIVLLGQNCHLGLISLFHYFLGVATFFSILFSLEGLVASSNGFPLSSAGKKGGRYLERKNVADLYLLKTSFLWHSDKFSTHDRILIFELTSQTLSHTPLRLNLMQIIFAHS